MTFDVGSVYQKRTGWGRQLKQEANCPTNTPPGRKACQACQPFPQCLAGICPAPSLFSIPLGLLGLTLGLFFLLVTFFTTFLTFSVSVSVLMYRILYVLRRRFFRVVPWCRVLQSWWTSPSLRQLPLPCKMNPIPLENEIPSWGRRYAVSLGSHARNDSSAGWPLLLWASFQRKRNWLSRSFSFCSAGVWCRLHPFGFCCCTSTHTRRHLWRNSEGTSSRRICRIGCVCW